MTNNCDIGASCGNTCISQAKHCISRLSPNAIDVVSRMASAIIEVTDRGKRTKSTSNTLSSPEEARSYLDVLEGIKAPHVELEWQQWASDKGNIDKVWDALDKKTKSAFVSAGLSSGRSAKGGAYLDGDTERGKAVLALFISTGGKDIAGNVLTKWNRQIELDHIVPVSKGGSDSPDNWQLLSTKVNRLKSNFDDETVIRKLKKQAEATQEDYNAKLSSDKEHRERQNAKLESFKDPTIRAELTDAVVSKMRIGSLTALVKGLGLTNATIMLGKKDEDGVLRPSVNTGTLTTHQMNRIAKDALILERMRNQGLTDYPHSYLPKTMLKLQRDLADQASRVKNPMTLSKPMKDAISYEGAPDISGYKLIPQLVTK